MPHLRPCPKFKVTLCSHAISYYVYQFSKLNVMSTLWSQIMYAVWPLVPIWDKPILSGPIRKRVIYY